MTPSLGSRATDRVRVAVLLTVGMVASITVMALGAPAAVAQVASAPIIIEAESYDPATSTDTDAINRGNAPQFTGGPDVWRHGVSSTGERRPGYVVNRTRSGETLDYQVAVADAGSYVITADVASQAVAPGGLQVFMDGTLAGTWDVDSTGHWSDFVTGQVGRVELTAGSHAVTVVFLDGGRLSLDSLALTPTADVPATGPVRIEAESYIAEQAVDFDVINRGNAPQFNGGVDVWRHGVSPGGFRPEGFVVNHTRTGETLAWMSPSLAAGNYELSVSVASQAASPGELTFFVDGVPAGTVDVDSTGHWWRFVDEVVGQRSLSSGSHLIEVQISGGGRLSLDALTLRPVNSPRPLGLTLEAESYDRGVDTDDDFGSADNSGTPEAYPGGTDVYNHAGGPDGPPRPGQIVGRTRDLESLIWDSVGLAGGVYRLEMSYAIGPTDGDGTVVPGDLEVWIDDARAYTFDPTVTGHWWSFRELTSTQLTIPEGDHRVELRFVDGGKVNLDWIRFVPERACPTELAAGVAPPTSAIVIGPADVYGTNLVSVNGDRRVLQSVLNAHPAATIAVLPGCYNVRRALPQTDQTILGLRAANGDRPLFHGQELHNRAITTPDLGSVPVRVGQPAPTRDTRTDVTIEGLEVTHYAPLSGYFGAVHVSSYKSGTPKDEVAGPELNWMLRDLVVTDNEGVGVVVAPGTTLEDSVIARNTYLGIAGGGGTGITLTHNDIHDNSEYLGQIDGQPGIWFHGGAVKLTRAVDAEISWNHIHDNYGQALWLDVVANTPWVHHNLIEGNTGVGIMHEISFGGVIEDNVILDHGWSNVRPEFSQGVWPSGIVVATSRDVIVQNNHVDQSGHPGSYTSAIGIVAQDRTASLDALWVYASQNTVFLPDAYRDNGANRPIVGYSGRDNTVVGNVMCNADVAGIVDSDPAVGPGDNTFAVSGNTPVNVGRFLTGSGSITLTNNGVCPTPPALPGVGAN